MKKVIIILLGIFISTVLAYATPTVETNKLVYSNNETITVNVINMLGDVKDWIAIYPLGSSNEWQNMLRWSWTGGFTEGSKTFEGLPLGEYEARVFFENSFNLEGSSSFSVEGNENEVNLTTTKSTYLPNEPIVVNFENMLGDDKDWIAIYPKDSSNEWKNVLRWKWTEGIVTGSFTFEALPLGEYEARAFFENSYDLEGNYDFIVEGGGVELNLTTTKSTYLPNEPIVVNFENMLGDDKDWIAIYPKDSSNEWKNVLRWKWTEGMVTGSFTFEALPLGEYEARAFFENSFQLEKSSSFTVSDVAIDTDAFIATWKIGASKSLQLSTFNDGGSTPFAFDFNVDWGDGTNSKNVTSTIQHHYESEGNFTVKVTGVYPIPQGLCFEESDQSGNPVGYQKLVSIDQWGTQKWKSMRRVFWNCKDFNIINDPKAPDLSETKDMNIMFWGATKFNQPIGHWDVSRIPSMHRMFENAFSFNQDLSGWNISALTLSLDLLYTSLSTENYDNMLLAWSQLNLQQKASISVVPTQHSANSAEAKQYIIDTFQWKIFDGGQLP